VPALTPDPARELAGLESRAGRLRVAGNAFWAITDQALFAGSNFVLNVMLARWLTPSGYGAFSVAFSLFLLLGTAHSALLTEPMTVLGPGKFGGRLPHYLRVLVRDNFRFGLLSSLPLLALGLGFGLFGSPDFALLFVTLALVSPLVLFSWLVRRACYVRLVPSLAALSGVVYTVLMLGGLWGLYRGHRLSTSSALAVMGASSLIAGCATLRPLGVSRTAAPRELRDEALHAHWNYGRWAMATHAIGWLPRNIYYLLLPAWGGLAESAALKALMNLMLPATHANSAMAILLIPMLVRARDAEASGQTVDNRDTFRRLTYGALALFVLGVAAYWLILTVFHRPLIHWLYGGRYEESGRLLWVLGLSLLAGAAVDVFGAALRALERPDRVFWSNLASTALALSVGLTLLATLGVMGAAIGLFLSSAIRAAAMWRDYSYLQRRAPSPPGSGL
jgi:O-antigen/teichoic acid export membrane protein